MTWLNKWERRMTAWTLPVIDRDNEAFWTWGSEGKLAIHRCAHCDYCVHPPVPFCPRCESRDVAPQAVSGRGRIVTFPVHHKAWVPDLQTGRASGREGGCKYG